MLPVAFAASEKRTADYVRHGITNLFAALNVATGEVLGECKPTRNGKDFLAFLKKAVKTHAGKEIHVVLDNLSTHTTPEVKEWLVKNPHVHFPFTPIGSSWLNQPVHDRWWAAACKAHGDRDGTRALIEVLLLARHMNHEHLVAGLAVALQAGALTADAVALEARKAAEAEQPEPAAPSENLAATDTATVTFLTERRMAHPPPDRCPQWQSMTNCCDAAREQMSYLGFLAELLMAECDDRARRRAERRIRAAAFPREKSLRTFDYEANPNIDPAVIHTLATCEWVAKGQPLCLIGDSGTGKSHLLIALGTEAAMKGFRVKYTLVTKLVNELVESADDMVLNKTIARYGRVDLLCIAELRLAQTRARAEHNAG